jgi:mercuric ion binding protein
MKPVILAAVAALGLAAVGAVVAGTVNPKASAPLAAEAGEQSARFAVANMTCALCPATVKSAMARVPGVRAVTVSFGAGTADVVFDPARASVAAIAAASAAVGYPARAVN